MKSYIIRDDVHGDIIINDCVAIDIIHTFEFQRLRRIKQFGGCNYPFPSGNHTRFSHCIGVYHVICKILSQKAFDIISDKDKLLVKLAGLLHDIGHGPFSHSFEYVSSCKMTHEEYGGLIIKDKRLEINKILVKNNIDVDEVARLIAEKKKKRVLSQLVSSQLDADRLDYLLRDAKAAGVKYSTIDIDWIIRHMIIVGDEIQFLEKAKYAIENYLVGRYHMYKQIYTHEKSIAFDVLLVNIINRVRELYNKGYEFNSENKFIIRHIKNLLENKVIDIIKYCNLDDYVFYTYIRLLMNEKDKILSDLCSRFVSSNLIKRIKNKDLKVVKENIKKSGYDLNYYFAKKDLKIVSYYDLDVNLKYKPHEIIWIKTDSGKRIKFIELSDIIDISKLKHPNKITYYYTINEFA